MPALPVGEPEPQSLDDILDWHRGIVDALTEQRASVQMAIRTRSLVASRFIGMTEADVDQYYDAQRRELDRLTVLNLVASAEASIRIDYHRRVKQRLKDPLSAAYLKWHKTLPAAKKTRPDFDEHGILDTLKDANVMNNHIVGRYRECLRARHWLGHGRYWAKPVEVDQLEPEEVFDRSIERSTESATAVMLPGLPVPKATRCSKTASTGPADRWQSLHHRSVQRRSLMRIGNHRHRLAGGLIGRPPWIPPGRLAIMCGRTRSWERGFRCR